MSSSDHSVTIWIEKLQNGDPLAQDFIWERYAEQINRLARRFLSGVQRRDSDEEDITIQVLDNLYRIFENGGFQNVKNRKQLWAVMLGMTRNKAAETARSKKAKKRGEGRVRGESVFEKSSAPGNGIEHAALDDKTPDSKVFEAEQMAEMIDMLGSDELRQVVLLRMAGYTNEEIAQRLNVSERTVERKFERVREVLQLDSKWFFDDYS